MSAELKNKALRLLARREHTRAELANKLSGEAGRDEVDAMLDRLQQAGLLSDARFAESLVAARGARYGAARLRHDLRVKGVAEEIIAGALPQDAEGEAARAREVRRRKFGAAPADRADYARQARFLQSRGFAADVIRRVLKEIEE
ncbi:MAG: recombination regulator RecX [Betaproteobacteria bacterium]|nr:recombination regulator RecX [Betaproteobacteria bacterium]